VIFEIAGEFASDFHLLTAFMALVHKTGAFRL